MDHIKILKRAWRNVVSYRALWIFGIILALTTSPWTTNVFQWRVSDRGENDNRVVMELGQDMQQEIEELRELFTDVVPSDVLRTAVAIGIGLACTIVLLVVVSKIARYVSETALIQMVNDHEETDERFSVRQGFRMGWSRIAGRLFLIDLLIDVPVALAFLLLFLLTFAPLLLWATESTPAGAIGTVATIGLFFLSIFLLIIVGAVLALLKRFFRRACALDGLGVTDSIRHGYAIVKQHLKDVGLMWLIMIGVDLAWLVLMLPVGLLLAAVGAVLAGLLALLVGGLASLALSEGMAVFLAVVVGIPIFLLVMVAPLAFLGGLREVFQSSSWTLTYRELCALDKLEPGESPEFAASGVE